MFAMLPNDQAMNEKENRRGNNESTKTNEHINKYALSFWEQVRSKEKYKAVSGHIGTCIHNIHEATAPGTAPATAPAPEEPGRQASDQVKSEHTKNELRCTTLQQQTEDL